MPLALDRRLELLAWAKAAAAIVVEDDYDSEFRFHGQPLAALKSHDAGDRVAYVGAFSKMLFPALRIAFVVLPETLVDPFAGALSLTCRYQPLGPQAVLADFIAEGHFGRHLRRMRLHYAARAEALQDAVKRRLDGVLALSPIAMGLDAPAFLARGVDAAALARRAARAGVEVRPLSDYAVDSPAPAGLQLGFAAVSPAAIEAGATALARALADVGC
jgi:GntR family transcriptional regulator/MocR family aminotransferase